MSFELNLVQLLSSGLNSLAAVERVPEGVRVTTHCMYPSNGLVQVMVRSGQSTVFVSDEGGAMGEALSAGIPVKDYGRQLAHLVKAQGVLIRDGVVFAPPMPIEAAPLAVLLVANASQEVARWLYEHMKIKRTRDFKELLASFLKKTFEDRVAPATIVGHSNKPHKFSNVISFPSGKRLIIDPVANEPSSVNARVVANLDIKAVHDPLIIQRIVYDDDEEWTPADLNLLQVGADAIPFSRSSEVIARLAASA